MLSAKLEAAINDQINKELYSAYLYLGMSAWCESANLPVPRVGCRPSPGRAKPRFEVLRIRARPCWKVTLDAIAKPEQEYASLLDLFAQVLEHERKVTA